MLTFNSRSVQLITHFKIYKKFTKAKPYCHDSGYNFTCGLAVKFSIPPYLDHQPNCTKLHDVKIFKHIDLEIIVLVFFHYFLTNWRYE